MKEANMKTKKSSILLMVTFAIYLMSIEFSLPISAQPQTAKELVSKSVSAVGGEEGFLFFNNFKLEANIISNFYSREIKGQAKMMRKGEKFWFWRNYDFGGTKYEMVSTYNGKTAWTDSWGTFGMVPVLNFQSDARHLPRLLVQKEATFNLGKETEIEGKKAIAVEVTFKGKKTVFYLSKKTYLILEISWKDTYFGDKDVKETIARKVRYQDYKELDKIRVPYKITMFQKGKKMHEMIIQKMIHNPSLDTKLFKQPNKKPDLRYGEETYH
jgi:hypothetical protein